MAYTDIDKPSDYFNTVTYTGNGSTQSITGVNFQPDVVWIKNRTVARSHRFSNSISGVGKFFYTDLTNAEITNANGITSFDSDGWSMGTDVGMNESGQSFVAWNWLASNTTASNTNGSIASTVSANTTSGFSIVSFTTTSGGNATIGHGLGSVPKMIIIKSRTNAYNWDIYHVSIGNTKRLVFTTQASETSTVWGSTTPTSSLFTMDQSFYGSGYPVIAYCFAEKKGFSKFGKYTGNGSTDGTFVYTGFKPAFIMTKSYSGYTGYWTIHDATRNPSNVSSMSALWANATDAESNAYGFDILSNGFKIRSTSATLNQSGAGYIYMAFAENPLVGTNNIPATAR